MDDSYDLGDPVDLELPLVDAAGAPLVPTAVALELVGPDGSLEPVPGVVVGDGVASATVEPTVDGIFTARWTVTGPGAGVTEQAFVVRPLGEALPYAATAEGVRARVLDVARPAGAVPAGATGRPARVSDAQVGEWIVEGAARVGRKLRLLEKMGAGDDDPIRLEYRAAAKGLTELYAAALLWDATYPQAAKGERYGAVLFDRFESGLKELAADLAVDFEAQLGGGGDAGTVVVDGDEPLGVTIDPYDLRPGRGLDVVISGGGASARFPAADPRIGRHRPW